MLFRFVLCAPVRLVCALLCVVFSSVAAAAPPAWAQGRILVQPKAGISNDNFAKVMKRNRGRSRGTMRYSKVHVIEVPADSEAAIVAALESDPAIEFAELDRLTPLSGYTPSDQLLSNAWHLNKMRAPEAWNATMGADIVVAVLDTGVFASHPDLAAAMLLGRNIPSANTDTSDVNGHGTAVAGVVAAQTDNGLGIASVAGRALILPVRITDRTDGYAYWSDIASGLYWAADQGADVANVSYGASESQTVRAAAQTFRTQGGVVVMAAGNEGQSLPGADSPEIVTVSATTSADVRASWSNYGPIVDVSAPGVSIYTTNRSGSYNAWSGTSFASPATAGVVALIMAANPELSPAEVQSVLEQSAVDLDADGWDPQYGHGRVDAGAAVALALATVDGDPDNEAPAVSITSPVANSIVNGQVSVTVSADDDTGVVRVALYDGLGNLIGSDTSAPYEFSVDTEGRGDGAMSLVAHAFDAADNEGSSTPVPLVVENTVTVEPDTVAPSVTIASPVDGAAVKRTVNVVVTGTDNVGVTRLVLSVNGSQVASANNSTLSYGWNTRKLAAGAYKLRSVAYDAAGNSAAQEVTVIVGSSDSTGSKGRGRKK
ncbi:MAG: S8 family serine peptidase [Gammaproteobacteria bacterium]|nr:S8 family serine peptidase [Gammaproteobacteria bacterium]